MIVNTTFVVDRAVADAWMQWLRMAYIAEATGLAHLTAPRLARIVTDVAEGDTDSYALQMHAADADALDVWLTRMQPDLLARMAGRWQSRVLHFTTLMEEVDL